MPPTDFLKGPAWPHLRCVSVGITDIYDKGVPAVEWTKKSRSNKWTPGGVWLQQLIIVTGERIVNITHLVQGLLLLLLLLYLHGFSGYPGIKGLVAQSPEPTVHVFKCSLPGDATYPEAVTLMMCHWCKIVCVNLYHWWASNPLPGSHCYQCKNVCAGLPSA